jgi:excisionase family DNA binding protein
LTTLGNREYSMNGQAREPAATGAAVTLMLTPEEAALALRVGRSKVYELMRAGVLRSVKIGGSRRISVTALTEFVATLEQDAA